MELEPECQPFYGPKPLLNKSRSDCAVNFHFFQSTKSVLYSSCGWEGPYILRFVIRPWQRALFGGCHKSDGRVGRRLA